MGRDTGSTTPELPIRRLQQSTQESSIGTENVRLLRQYLYEALDHGRAYYLYGAPGTQKTYVLQHLIAELNRSEIAKNGEGRRAYYVYLRQGIHSLDLMKRVAQSCGAIGLGTVDRTIFWGVSVAKRLTIKAVRSVEYSLEKARSPGAWNRQASLAERSSICSDC